MKKKYFSLASFLLSLATMCVLAIMALLFVLRVAGGKDFVPEVEKSFWLYEVVQRLSKAGFNIFFSIIGVIFSVILLVYRGTLAYFYFKVFRGDEEFYKERKKDIIFFSVIAGVAAVVACVFFVNNKAIPPEFKPITLILFILYTLLCALPIIELLINGILKNLKTAEVKGETVPTKEGIVKELDTLADKTVKEQIERKEEKNESKKEENKNGNKEKKKENREEVKEESKKEKTEEKKGESKEKKSEEVSK